MRLLSITILAFIFTFSLHSKECDQYIDDCEYYYCMNNLNNCSDRSYFVKTGLKYCNKFEKRKDHFSEKGQDWIESTKSCLIHKLDQIKIDNSCKEYGKEAVKHHFQCYVDAGYCQLSRKDKRAVFKVIRFSLWRPRMLKTALQVLRQCRKE